MAIIQKSAVTSAHKRAPIVLLFYDGYERKARREIPVRLFHQSRCAARGLWRRVTGKQVDTGFHVAFMALVDGLRRLGCDVRINDFTTALANPSYPIGLAGYPSVLNEVNLPNPTIFGPGDPGYPASAGAWARQEKVKAVIQPSPWFVDYYRPYCGEKMICCPVGIDLDALEDSRGKKKSVDVLIYDKIRWYRETIIPAVRQRLISKLEEDGLTFEILEYGKHTQQMYFALLRRSRSMAFLCEHETQGLACEEAMGMNVPVFAWEEGTLVDPCQIPFAKPGLQVSSVPYFDDQCGRRFTVSDIEDSFDAFWRIAPELQPRLYVAARLRPSETAKVYWAAYADLIAKWNNQADPFC